ncbi:class I SAM-dependent methyltransferase [Leucobacter sp. GX24907]
MHWEPMSAAQVRAAYGARAAEYRALLGTIADTAEPDRQLVLEWALSVDGAVIDVGCGPGQWTNFLREGGVEIEGVDPVPEFVEGARAAYPETRYRVGRAEDLRVADGSLGGILSWYSLIHVAPEEIDAPLMEFVRCLRLGGGLVLGFFTGPELVAFDHAVATAYFWPIDRFAERVEAAGFTVLHSETRTDAGARPHAVIVAEGVAT